MTTLEDLVVEVSVALMAPPDQAFALLSDVERMAGLGPEHVAATWDGEARGLGARWTGRNRRGEREWEVPCEVVGYDPPRLFAWRVGDPEAPTALWSYELAPSPGGTTVVQRFRHGSGWSFLRRAVEKYPERAEELIAGRAEELEQNMRTVLVEAGRLLEAS